MNAAQKINKLFDLIFDEKVDKEFGLKSAVTSLLGENYTKEAVNALSVEQRSEAVLNFLQTALLNQIRRGGQMATQFSLKEKVIAGGEFAINQFKKE